MTILQNRKVPYGHRIVLEARLLMVFNNAVNLISKIIGEFDKLKGDQVGVNDERDVTFFFFNKLCSKYQNSMKITN